MFAIEYPVRTLLFSAHSTITRICSSVYNRRPIGPRNRQSGIIPATSHLRTVADVRPNASAKVEIG